MAVRVGTSGWSYDDWVGRVYPRALPPSDRLGFYAQRFPTVEVNVTFYRTPPPPTVRAWLEKVRELPRFELTLKAPRALTEERLGAGSVEAAAAEAAAFARDVVAPVADAGRLGAVLLQLAPRVRATADALARLDAALRALDGFDVAVEPRHASWLVDGALAPEARALLDARGAALVAVDGPGFPPLVEGEAPHAYARFHGRNADVWDTHDVEDDPQDPRMNRYHYAYRDDEVRPWAERLARLAREKRDVRVYFNNHPEGHAYRDAERFEALVADAGAPVARVDPGPQRRLDAFEEP